MTSFQHRFRPVAGGRHIAPHVRPMVAAQLGWPLRHLLGNRRLGRNGHFATLLVTLLASAVLVAGCGQNNSGNAAASPGLQTIAIASGANPYLLQAFAADTTGVFAKHGLRLEWIKTVSGGAAIIAAVTSGSAQFMNTTVGGAGSAISQGVPIRFVCGLSNRIDRVFEVRKGLTVPDAQTAGFKATLSAFRGLKIGVNALGSGNQLDAIAALGEAGISKNDVTWIAVGSPDAAQTALATGQIDVATAYAGEIEQLEAAGVSYPTVDFARDIPAYKNVFDGGWLASSDFIQNHSDQVRSFCSAINEATPWLKAKGNRQSIINILKKEFGYSDALAGEFPDGSFVAGLSGCLDRTAMQNALTVAMKQGIVGQSVTVDSLLAPGAVTC